MRGSCSRGAASSAIIYLYNSQALPSGLPSSVEPQNIDALASDLLNPTTFVDYGLTPDAAESRNYTLNGNLRGISVVSTTSFAWDGTPTSTYDGVGIGAGNSGSASVQTSLSWGRPYGLGLRASGTVGAGRFGGSGSIFLSTQGMVVTFGLQGGVARTGANITIGERRRGQ